MSARDAALALRDAARELAACLDSGDLGALPGILDARERAFASLRPLLESQPPAELEPLVAEILRLDAGNLERARNLREAAREQLEGIARARDVFRALKVQREKPEPTFVSRRARRS